MAKCNSVTEWREKCLKGGTEIPHVCGCIFCECTCPSGAMDAPVNCQCPICYPELHTIGYGRKDDEKMVNTPPMIEEINPDKILQAYIQREKYTTDAEILINGLRDETNPRCPYYIYLIQSLVDSYGTDYFKFLNKETGVPGTAEDRIMVLIRERDTASE